MAGLAGTAARLAAHLIQQTENDVDTRQVHFEFLGERTDKAGAVKRRCGVEGLGGTGGPGHRNKRGGGLPLPPYEVGRRCCPPTAGGRSGGDSALCGPAGGSAERG